MSHELAIKVLRLGKPHFDQRSAFEEPGIYQEQLVLPRTIGPCFAGEQFTCLLAVASKTAVSGHVHVEMQGREAVVLFDEQVELDPAHAWTHQLVHELAEPGPRVLQVQIRYDKKTLTKSFSFEVSPAVATRVRAIPIDASSGLAAKFSHAIEIQVENVTESVLTLQPGLEWRGVEAQVEPFDSMVLKPHDVAVIGCLAAFSEPEGQATVPWAREPLGIRGRVHVQLRR